MLEMKKVLLIGMIIIGIIVFLFQFDFFYRKPKIYYNDITKIYFAPKSKIRIIVHSKNCVGENSDLGNGKAFVKLYQENSINDTVFLNTSSENIDFITFQKNKIPFECSQMQKNKLYDYLNAIGFENLDKNEIAELRDAMTLINYGLKATFLEGQTKFITVEK